MVSERLCECSHSLGIDLKGRYMVYYELMKIFNVTYRGEDGKQDVYIISIADNAFF